jgi:uncharacterized protein YecE (DUF72 family)
MRLRAGTSGWSYAAWKGRFYPADLPAGRMLAWYATRFDAVEVNATYYRMPRPDRLAEWRGQVPEAFQFALKAPERMAQLRGAAAARAMAAFERAAAALGPTLGPMLFRPPPGPPDVAWVRELLALVPRGRRAVLEPRDPAWLRDDVLGALVDGGAALCATDLEEGGSPLVPTAPFGYLRLRRADYDEAALHRWAERALAQPWTEAFVFFRHEDEARGPRLARAFLDVTGGAAAAQP